MAPALYSEHYPEDVRVVAIQAVAPDDYAGQWRFMACGRGIEVLGGIDATPEAAIERGLEAWRAEREYERAHGGAR